MDRAPLLDMTPDGRFRAPPGPGLGFRIAVAAVVLAVLAGAAALAALVFSLALALLPVALGAALVAWAAFRFQRWRARSFGGARHLRRS